MRQSGMFVLFEDAGKFLAGRVLSETDASAQVELESGKRVKVKTANVLLRFEKPAPAELLREAERLRNDVIQVDAFARGHFAVSAIGGGSRRLTEHGACPGVERVGEQPCKRHVEERRVGEEGPGEGDELLLPRRQQRVRPRARPHRPVVQRKGDA